MHDFHAADKILKMALESAGQNDLKKVDKLVVELGHVVEHGEEILADNLKFNIDILAKGSVVEGAEIVVLKKKGMRGYSLKEIVGE